MGKEYIQVKKMIFPGKNPDLNSVVSILGPDEPPVRQRVSHPSGYSEPSFR